MFCRLDKIGMIQEAKHGKPKHIHFLGWRQELKLRNNRLVNNHKAELICNTNLMCPRGTNKQNIT